MTSRRRSPPSNPEPPTPPSLASTSLAELPVTFVGSFPNPSHPLSPALPEVVFIGRSNVGKSSLLNSLLGRPVARVSGTPGKTQLLNVFQLPQFYLLDLPGYGFARASKAERVRFRRLVEGVLNDRKYLSAVVWLLDIRHVPSVDDREMEAVIARTARPWIGVLTKSDKLPRGQRIRAARDRAFELGVDPASVVVSSGRTGLGIAELTERILEATRG